MPVFKPTSDLFLNFTEIWWVSYVKACISFARFCVMKLQVFYEDHQPAKGTEKLTIQGTE